MRILVIGCGGIGGVTTAKLHQAGVDVTAVSRNESFRRCVTQNGLRLIENHQEVQVDARVVDEPEGVFDLMILTTQPTDVEAAAVQYAPWLASDGQVLVFQNGLCEERVETALNQTHRVLGGVVSWGATHHGDGRVERTAQGRITLGALQPLSADERSRLETVLQSVAPIQHTENLRGARWSKLILNSMVSALGTLHGTRLGPVVALRTARRLALQIITEGVRVAQAADVHLEKVAGTLDLEKLSLSPQNYRRGSLGLFMKHALLRAVGYKYRHLHSSLLRAIEAGKPPAIDFLNGDIVRHGGTYGLECPLNHAICRKVHGMARGDVKPGPAVIDALAQYVHPL